MKAYIRWDGYRVKHKGKYRGNGNFVSFDWLCGRDSNSDTDIRVSIFHSPNIGYTYKEIG
ncbi:MAG: hypothetical protein ABTQ25_06100 [Nitrosomonas ureae]